MVHSSVKLDTPCEFINITPYNPLISKCEIKVCYVSDEPNRNKTVINRETALKIAASLPGSPIVGKYNEAKADFEEHNKVFQFKDGKLVITDDTQPYGFVDLNAKIWFQKFVDDGMYERLYLMTEGWIWTGQFPEAKRVVTQGNNQSMELDKNFLDGFWTKDSNGKPQFFIINEAIIEKLCILGDDEEPCFEGSRITEPRIQFSYDDGFQTKLYNMMNELKELLEGGTVMPTEVENKVITEEPVPATENTLEVETPEVEIVVEEPAAEPAPVEEEPATLEPEPQAACPECGKLAEECTCGNTYNLEEIPEYVELQASFSALEIEFNSYKEATEATIASLTEFKNAVERQKKQEMIDSFYMLSDEDKKDVIENIDSYSIDDIEGKLSIICVRNKVNFNLDSADKEDAPTIYNLDGAEDYTPAWIKAVQSVAKEMNN